MGDPSLDNAAVPLPSGDASTNTNCFSHPLPTRFGHPLNAANYQQHPTNPNRESDIHRDDHEDDVEQQSEDEDDARLVLNEPAKPRRITQKKALEQVNFSNWLSRNRPSLFEKDAKQHSAPSQEESLQYMIKSCEGGQKIIDSPRDYQLELFERAKHENTIAVLDTGSGKTLIAILLLEHTISQELEDRAKGFPRRTSFFLVDKVALAFQQHAVLECNLAHSVALFFGQGVRDSWNSTFWREQYEKHEVIVCTAEILNQCLQRAYIRIDQINLLIFDEAHHTKKDHPYARIIKDHYVVQVNSDLRLPRIFGMTASPVDAQVDVRQAATELEGILHSRIATTADPDSLRRTVGKPKREVQYMYSSLPPGFDTILTTKLRPLVSHNRVFSKALAFSDTASRELGAWFIDRMWQLCLEDDSAFLKLEAKTERNYAKDMATAEVVEKQKDRIRAAHDVIRAHDFVAPTAHNVSSKVNALVRILVENFHNSNTRCIVFVQQRWKAMLLSDFFQKKIAPQIPGIQTSFLMGATDDGVSATSFRAQLKTIIDFKKGKINCIFATAIAEEGLDIPDCNLIIRFDLCKTMIQYIQSRGRARQEDSIYVHMLEQGNGEHRRLVYQNATNEHLLRKFCSTQPEDRLLKGSNCDMDYFLRKERIQRQCLIKSTGAKLTYKNSMSVLGEFVSTLRNQDEFSEGMGLAVDFAITPVQGGFVCEVLMPPLSPVSNAVGRIYSTKQVAKCSAAFEMCLKLLEMKFLDGNLRSKFIERRHAFANARLAVSSKKRAQYDMRIKPQIWAELGMPKKLYPMVLSLSNPTALHRPARPLLMLTRNSLPQIKPFPMFLGSLGNSVSSDAICRVLSIPIEVTEPEMQLFTRFTLKLFEDVFAKRYAANSGDIPYFFAPTSQGHDFAFEPTSNVRNLIDWPLLRHVLENEAEAYKGNEPDGFFQDKYVVDPHDGSRRFWLSGVRRDLTCQSPVPTEVELQPSYRQWKKGEVAHTILNWSMPRWKFTCEAKEKTWKENQPVAVGFYASLRRNFLADMKEDQKNPLCYFVLEPLRISPIAADVVSMAYLVPSIIHRIEQNLIALEACKILQLDIHADLALEALTKDSDNQGEDEGRESLEVFEPVDFQPGMGANYERLEFLGDSFLKMATTISIFTLIPNKDEFDYHCERMVMVCNQNLFGVALQDNVKLQEYIRSKSFERGTWYPGLKLIHGKTHLKTLKQMDEHKLADKSIADVCEALIGAAYMTTRKDNEYDLAVQAVTRLVNNKRHPMMKWEDYYAAYSVPDWQLSPANATERDMAQKIEEITGYKFKHLRGLRSAFRHPSRPFEFDKVPTYQRLEFLGDALLDMVCVDYLFHIAPDKGPQWLTEHKMAVVSNQFLGCLAVSLGLHRHILHNHSTLGAQILEYATEITEARRNAEDAAQASGKSRADYARDFWIEARQPPKCIPDVLEALIGAMFVDSGYDLTTVQRFFGVHFLPYFSDMHIYDAFVKKHPVTFCTQFIYDNFGCHAYGLHSQEIQVEDDIGTLTGQTQVVAGIMIHEQVVEGAVRESGRNAKIAAARKALDKLKGMSKEAFVAEFRCDCKPGEEAEDISESATAI